MICWEEFSFIFPGGSAACSPHLIQPFITAYRAALASYIISSKPNESWHINYQINFLEFDGAMWQGSAEKMLIRHELDNAIAVSDLMFCIAV